MEITGTFARVTGQRLNPTKSVWWAANRSRDAGTVEINGHALDRVEKCKQLGVQLRFQCNQSNTVGENRAKKGIEIAKRIRWAPLPFHARARLLQSLVTPGSLYGVQIAALPQQMVNALRSATLTALWGDTRKLRCKELVLTLLTAGHLTDPAQASMYQTLKMFRRMMIERPHLREPAQAVWALGVNARAPGPIAEIRKVLLKIGWTWDCFSSFGRPGRPALAVWQHDEGWWLHQIRHGIRMAQWKIAAARRNDCSGLDGNAGVDKKATCALLSSRKTEPASVGRLRTIMSGSLRVGKRLHDAGLAESPICQFCLAAEETADHLFWECPAWQTIRTESEGLPRKEIVDRWPPCTRQCGIFMEDSRLQEEQDKLVGEEQRLQQLLEAQPGPFDASAARRIAWTDGACTNNQDARLRRGGCGVFFGPADASNVSAILPGVSQSNNRAELLAVIMALLRCSSELEVRTDSNYVVNGVLSWQQRRAHGCSDNSDLWSKLTQILHTRPLHALAIVWVKGHANESHIERGITTWEDKVGNDAADALATSAAALHSIDNQVALEAAFRSEAASAAQQMMLRILEARFAAEDENEHASVMLRHSLPSEADPG